VADIATLGDLLLAYEDEPMWSALRKLGIRDVGRLPVVKREDETHLVGVVRRQDIIQAYNLAIIKRSQHQYHADIVRLGRLIDAEFIHVDISPEAGVVDQRISEIDLPEECLIVSVQRGRKLYTAHGHTILQSGDHLTVFSQDGRVPEIRKILTQELERPDETISNN
jgi:CIC family chloride channel protein